MMCTRCLCCNPGRWSSPSVKGSRPPPCVAFSLTMTDKDQAVMFGGFTSSGFSSEEHVLHLPTMVSWNVTEQSSKFPVRESLFKLSHAVTYSRCLC